MISVIIPAHNEEVVIGRCLRSLLREAQPGELQVIVAANGCTDGTEAVVASFGSAVQLVLVSQASKTSALNAGDLIAEGFPRIYMDADVEFDTQGVRAVAAALLGSHLAASPELRVVTDRSSLLVKSYYRFWSQLPSVRDDLVGRGVYAVSRQGRQRFEEFPAVINDDHFFRKVFEPERRTVVRGCSSRVWAPRTARSLVERKTRVQAGQRLEGRRDPARAGIVAVVRTNPWRLVDLPAFVVVGLLARARSRRVGHKGGPIEWGRDDSRG